MIVPFNFEGLAVRTVLLDGEPWFAAPDVCRVLDLAHVGSALRILDADEKGVRDMHTLRGIQVVTIVSEPGLYKLMARSRKPEAKRFDRWVRHEVLPAIRMTGGYIAAAPEETPEQIMARALFVAQATMDRLNSQVAELQPKADSLDRLAMADGSLNITEAAKVLQVRPKDLFSWLDRNGWIYRRAGATGWLGYQAHTSNGDLEHKVTTVHRSDGTEKVTEQVRITPRGLTKLAKVLPSTIGGMH